MLLSLNGLIENKIWQKKKQNQKAPENKTPTSQQYFNFPVIWNSSLAFILHPLRILLVSLLHRKPLSYSVFGSSWSWRLKKLFWSTSVKQKLKAQMRVILIELVLVSMYQFRSVSMHLGEMKIAHRYHSRYLWAMAPVHSPGIHSILTGFTCCCCMLFPFWEAFWLYNYFF